ncbi:MAG: HAMP domain-containing histidine kinase [Planctomycetes bacterium]|nr:HAMP domain-containing histidine kinase [Planctomycetota bacterium]
MRARASGGRWRLVYGACAGGVVVALTLVSRIALELEREHAATQHAARQRELREDRCSDALWQLDSRLLPLLAREGARPYFEYLAYYPQECAYTRFLAPLSKGDVLVASPLLLTVAPPVRLHFQVDAAGRFSSPQAPEGNQRDLAEASQPPPGALLLDVAEGQARLARVRELVSPQLALASVATIEACELAVLPAVALTGVAAPEAPWQSRRAQTIDAKSAARSDANLSNRSADPLEPAPAVDVGTFVPLWLGTPAELICVRRVTVAGTELLQGFWCDWPALRALLLDAVAALVPGASLEPVAADGAAADPGELTLSTVPARLVLSAVPAVEPAPLPWSATRTALVVAWLVVGAALVGGWFLTGSSVALGLRRSRFAAAVTHELRTPLTTFRMYSEMLADGMVADAATRQGYLDTLKEQSGRLALLVENVLAYARVEEGRFVARRATTTVGELVQRIRPTLDRRAADAGLLVRVTGGEAAGVAGQRVTTDVDAVEQILLNLVDNACKYAADVAPAEIELGLARRDRTVELTLRDHGPGIAPDLAHTVFEPFERGACNGDARPGVGLGLALARGLARDLGGDLRLRAPADGGRGAALVLVLPLEEAAPLPSRP